MRLDFCDVKERPDSVCTPVQKALLAEESVNCLQSAVINEHFQAP